MVKQYVKDKYIKLFSLFSDINNPVQISDIEEFFVNASPIKIPDLLYNEIYSFKTLQKNVQQEILDKAKFKFENDYVFYEFIYKLDDMIHVQWDEVLFSCISNEIYIFTDIEIYNKYNSLSEEEKNSDYINDHFLNSDNDFFLCEKDDNLEEEGYYY